MPRNTWIAVVVVLVILGGGWLLLRSRSASTPAAPTVTTPSSTESASPTASEGGEVSEEKLVKIGSGGFSPQTLTIKAGETVSWQNDDSSSHTVNSAPHPTHADYPPLNSVGLLKPGEKKSLQFPASGIYKYHDHLNPSLTGSITVQ